jgi:hypothetical protein
MRQLDLPLFPPNFCGRSSAPCALTICSSTIICALCGSVASIPAAWLTPTSSYGRGDE